MQDLNVEYNFPTSTSVPHSDKALICKCFIYDLTSCYKHQLAPSSQKACLWTTVGKDILSQKKVSPFWKMIDHKYRCWQQPTQVPIGTDSLKHKYQLVPTASNTSANWYRQPPTQVPIFIDSFQQKCLVVLTAPNTSAYW